MLASNFASQHARAIASIKPRPTRRVQVGAASVGNISLLEWASGAQRHAVDVQELPSNAGRGLVAVRDIRPNEQILSIPFDKVYSSKPEDELEMHWSVDMALRLLKDKHACQGAGARARTGCAWCPWLEQLPAHVLTPLEFTEEEVASIGDEGLSHEVRVMQGCMEASYEILQAELQALGCSYQDFLAAVQVLHSRCFFQPETSCHMAVPGIDMANHNASPNAQVAVQHSPQAVQGFAAMEEVCDPTSLSCEDGIQQSQFQLVAGPQGIRKGEEVTISYGSMWPDAAFLLLFGFIPEGDNPQNSCILFSTFESMVACYMHLQQQLNPKLASIVGLSEEVDEAMSNSWQGAEHWSGLFITKDGMDGRMPAAFKVLEDCFARVTDRLTRSTEGDSSTSGVAEGSVTLQALLSYRAGQRIQEFQAIEQEGGVASGEQADELTADRRSNAKSLVRTFRHRQLGLLQNFLRKR